MAVPGGKRDRLLRFERPRIDENGDPAGGYRPVIVLYAAPTILRGSEPVLQQRLQGVQPYAFNVRACHALEDCDNSWRIVDQRSGEVFGIINAVLSVDRASIDVLAQTGAATGVDYG